MTGVPSFFADYQPRAVTANAAAESIAALQAFAKNLGLAFQIIDDPNPQFLDFNLRIFPLPAIHPA
jgi:geranylgeranyl pyrophosphate synthase